MLLVDLWYSSSSVDIRSKRLNVNATTVWTEIRSPRPFIDWTWTAISATPTLMLVLDLWCSSSPGWHKVHNIKSKCYILQRNLVSWAFHTLDWTCYISISYYSFQDDDGGIRDLCFFLWCADDAGVRLLSADLVPFRLEFRRDLCEEMVPVPGLVLLHHLRLGGQALAEKLQVYLIVLHIKKNVCGC